MRTIAPMACIALLAATAAIAEGWTVDPASSTIGFASVKNGVVAETHEFGALSGRVGADGTAKLDIQLASVETRVDIRNERMRDILFNISQYPIASVSTAVDLAALEKLGIGERAEIEAEVTVTANGTDAIYDAYLNVTRIADGKVAVSANEPIVIDVHDFGYESGIAELQKIAGLDSIAPVVPVTFDIVFAK